MSELYHIVCMPVGPSPFADNITAACNHCDRAIMHRPNLPEPNVKMCASCSFDAMDAAEDSGEEIEVVSTPEQRAEIEALHGVGSLEKALALAEEIRAARRATK